MPDVSFDLADLDERRQRHARSKRTRAGFIGSALALAVVAIVVATLIVAPGSTPSAQAAAGPDSTLPPVTLHVPALGAGQYGYTKSEVTMWNNIVYGPIVTGYHTTTSQIWWGTDASGREADGTVDETYQAGTFPLDVEKPGLTDLPTDPMSLRRYLVGATAFGASPVPAATDSPGQSAESVRVTRMAADLLVEPVLTPSQRVTILELLSGYADDGVTVDMHATDPAGRAAYLISFKTTSGPTEYDYYVDPATHDLLAATESIPQSGQLMSATVVKQVGVATSTTDVPTNGWLAPAGPIHLDTSVPRAFARRAARNAP
jgi:hypothetical protein